LCPKPVCSAWRAVDSEEMRTCGRVFLTGQLSSTVYFTLGFSLIKIVCAIQSEYLFSRLISTMFPGEKM
jgi:hypothetical protein